MSVFPKQLAKHRVLQRATTHLHVNMLRKIIFASLLTLAIAQNFSPSLYRKFDVSRLSCGQKCHFRFCADRQRVVLTAVNITGGSTICRKNKDIDRVLEVGEALVSQESGDVKISEWRPVGLYPPISPDLFSVGSHREETNSGIHVSDLHGNQNDYLNGQCITLPITRYEQVQRRKDGRRRVVVRRGKRPEKDCIAFEPRTYKFLFEVIWDSGDDLDLSLIEPDGTLLDFKNPRSQCGQSREHGIDGCDRDIKLSHEFITYPSPTCEGRLQRGRYTIRLNHATNCWLNNRPRVTRYEVHFLVDGINQFTISGNSAKDRGEEITSFEYRM